MKKRLQEMAVDWRLEQVNGRPVARVVLIKAGVSLNGVEYPPDVLANAAHLYEGRPCLLDHSWDPSVRDLAGWFRNVKWNRDAEQLEADLHFLDTAAGRTLLDLAREEARLKEEGVLAEGQHIYGFSHVVFGATEEADEGSGACCRLVEVIEVVSVDAVVFPAAGGEQVELKASVETAQTAEAQTEQTKPEVLQCVNEAVHKIVKEEQLAERATRFRDLPLAERTRNWNGTTARANLKKWASSDGSGNKDTIDWARYRWGFFWYDHTDPEKFTAYKLPFVDIIGGDPYAIPRGVFAAAGAIMGARGGADIPEGDIESVKRHIASYYRKMREEWDDDSLIPPWQRENQALTDEEASAYIEAFGLEAWQQAFGYKPDEGPNSTEREPVEEEVNEVDDKEKMKEALEREIRERVAEEFAQKSAALMEENKQLKAQVEALTEQVKQYEAEKAEAERKAKLDALFKKYEIEGVARQTLEAIVEDMDVEKAEKVIALAAGGSNQEQDPDVEKRVESADTTDAVKLGEEFAKAILGKE